MTFFTLVLIAIIILAVIGLGWQTFAVAVLDGFDRALDVSIPIIKNLTQEAQAQTTGKMGFAKDPNPQIVELANGGLCKFDENLKELETSLGVDFPKSVEDKLRLETEIALNNTAISLGYPGGAEPFTC